MRKKTLIVLLMSITVVAAGPPASAAVPADPVKPGSAGPPAVQVAPEVLRQMREQQPAVKAANLIRQAAEAAEAVEAAKGKDGQGFSGIVLEGNSVVLWYQGKPPPSVAAVVASARKTVQVTVKQARHSGAELRAASERLTAYLRTHPEGPAHGLAVPADGSGLTVLMDGPATASEAALPGVEVPVRTEQRQRMSLTGRFDDYAPFWGGARIRNSDNGSQCTSGFGVRSIYDGREYLLTAGHCGRPGGGWTNGDGTRWIGYGAYEHVAYDLLLVETNAGGFIFDGGVTNAFSRRVSGWSWAYGGQWVCSSGSVTGGQCSLFTDDDSYTVCGLDNYNYYECYYGLAGSLSWYSDPAGISGDSGGPVFTLDGDNVTALGTLTGSGGPMLYWAGFGTANSVFGVVPITGP